MGDDTPVSVAKAPPLPRPTSRLARLPAPRILASCVLLLAAAATILLLLRDPAAAPEFFPACPWHALTGLHCPGCGITRALHALIHGRVLDAFDYNALGVILLGVTAGVLARPGWRALRENQWQPPRLPARTAKWLVICAVLWTLLRNLPWSPFSILAP